MSFIRSEQIARVLVRSFCKSSQCSSKTWSPNHNNSHLHHRYNLQMAVLEAVSFDDRHCAACNHQRSNVMLCSGPWSCPLESQSYLLMLGSRHAAARTFSKGPTSLPTASGGAGATGSSFRPRPISRREERAVQCSSRVGHYRKKLPGNYGNFFVHALMGLPNTTRTGSSACGDGTYVTEVCA